MSAPENPPLETSSHQPVAQEPANDPSPCLPGVSDPGVSPEAVPPEIVSPQVVSPQIVTTEIASPATQPPGVDSTIIPPPIIPPPIENPAWNGWDVLLIAFLTFILMVVLQSVVFVVARWLVYPRLAVADLVQKPILLLVSQFLLYPPVAAGMILLIEGKYHVRFWRAVRWNWPDGMWKFLGLGAAMMMAFSMLENLLPVPKDTPFEHLFDRPRDAYLIAILAVTLAPLMEELFFRGLFYPVVAKRWGAAWGIFLAALPFGLMHLPQYGWAWSAALIIFLVGIVCGVVRAATKSVAASVLVHAGYNGTQMLIALVMTRGFTHFPKM